MIHWLRFAVLVFSTGFALWRTRHTLLFFLYFTSHLGGTITAEITYQAFGDKSAPYFWTYAVGSSLICLFALWIAVDSVPSPRRMRKMAIPLILAVPIAHKFQLECGSGLNRGTWLLLAVGAILFFCGMVTSAAAVYSHQNHNALLIFGLLWLAQAMYFFGYIQTPSWTASGYWFPALLASAGFLGVALTVPRTPSERGRGDSSSHRPI